MTKKKKPEELVKIGRPTVMTPEVQDKFIQGFKLGFNDSECCAYVDICRQTFIEFRDRTPDFFNRVMAAKEHPFLMAKHTISKNMGKPEVAKWFLEKRRREEFGDIKKLEISGIDEKYAKMSAQEKIEELLKTDEVS